MNDIEVPYELSFGDKAKYILKSAIIHDGDFSSGHYYAIAKYQEVYYQMNDGVVKPLTLAGMKLLMRGAYVTFFEKVDEEIICDGNFSLFPSPHLNSHSI